MKNIRDFIYKPLLTEKVVSISGDKNKVVFVVDKRLNKIQLKKAIGEIFNVTVMGISTLNVKPKKKRLGRFEGKTSSYKKAILTLKEGDKIDYFEGA